MNMVANRARNSSRVLPPYNDSIAAVMQVPISKPQIKDSNFTDTSPHTLAIVIVTINSRPKSPLIFPLALENNLLSVSL